MIEHHGRRQNAFAHQSLRAVDIGQHQIQQRGPLNERIGQRLPGRLIEQQRQRIEFPRPIRPLRRTDDVVGDAAFAQQPLDLFGPLDESRRPGAIHAADELLPRRAELTVGRDHFVERRRPAARSRPVAPRGELIRQNS